MAMVRVQEMRTSRDVSESASLHGGLARLLFRTICMECAYRLARPERSLTFL